MKTEAEQPAQKPILKIAQIIAWVVLWVICLGLIGDMWWRQTVQREPILVFLMTHVALPGGDKTLSRAHHVLGSLALAGWAAAEFAFGSEEDQRYAVMLICAVAVGLCLNLFSRIWEKKASPALKGFARSALSAVLIVTIFLSVVVIAGLFLKGVSWHEALIDNWYIALVIVYLPLMGVGWLLWAKSKARSQP